MKKLLCVLFCVVFVFSLAGCGKIAGAEPVVIEPAPEVLTIQEKLKDRVYSEVPYDNETPADKAKVLATEDIPPEMQFPASGYFGSYSTSQGPDCFTVQELQERGFLIRHNFGEYYTVNPTEDGGYYFFFFTYFGGQCREKSACRITKLSDVANFEKYIKKGTILEEKLQERFPDIACGDDIGDYYVCWTSDLTEKIIRVEMQGSRMKVTEIFSNYDSVLTYLLPQDLALIS